MVKIDNLIDTTISYNEILKGYNYQQDLTPKLDKLDSSDDFTEINLLEIVLWKVNRYPAYTPELISNLKNVKNLKCAEDAKELLSELLITRGFDLPMASTVLRFLRSDIFQIIDKRVYRFITPERNTLYLSRNIDKKIELYFNYLQRLREVCTIHNIPFEISDRVFYQLDKIHNGHIPLN